MKQWNKPELLSMGLENTFDLVEPLKKPDIDGGHTDATQHYCHKGGSSSICTGSTNDHANINSSANKGHKFTGQVCTHPNHADLNGASSCCCVGIS